MLVTVDHAGSSKVDGMRDAFTAGVAFPACMLLALIAFRAQERSGSQN